VRCNSGKVYTLNADGTVGSYVADPNAVDSSPILQASADVPGEFIDAVCGPGR
jgi:hypothetical protein